MGKVPEEILRILACPGCRGKLSEKGDALVCGKCGRLYEIRGGMPILMPPNQNI